jgi:hypothetical protein
VLKKINQTYFIISILLYIILAKNFSEKFVFIIPLAIFTIVLYSLMLQINNKILKNRIILTAEIFLYNAIFILFYNSLSYIYRGNFFLFSEADAVFYQTEVLKLMHMPFGQAIDYYLSYMPFDDLGMILILYPLYHIVESNLILNIFYLFIGTITSLSLYSLSKNFMSKKYAFVASLSYSISSFVIFFHSSGLKESFLVMLIILSFDFYYKFFKSKNILYFIVSILFMGTILLFRPAIFGMIIVSIGFGSFFGQKSGLSMKLLSLMIIIFLIIISDDIIKVIERYSTGGFDMLIYARESEGMIIGSLPFTYSVNILSQLIGPLPTLVSQEKIMLTIMAPSLIFRVLLSFPFWIGIWFIYKTRASILYPLLIFVLMEMGSLALILEGLEFRKALPHIAIVFIIAFWFMDKYDNKQFILKKRKRFKIFCKVSLFLLVLIILFWNFK